MDKSESPSIDISLPYYLNLPTAVSTSQTCIRKITNDIRLEILYKNLKRSQTFAITALFWAVIKNNSDIVRAALNSASGFFILPATAKGIPHQLCDEYTEPLVRSILKQHITLRVCRGYINLKLGGTNDWTTVLHWAAEMDDTELLEYALASGALVEEKDYTGCTALHIAAMWDNVRGTRKLLEWEADVDAVNSAGDTPLQVAREADVSTAVIWLLLENRKDVDFVDVDGMPLSHLAVRYSHIVLVWECLDEGGVDGLRVDVNARDPSGGTALHEAARLKNGRVIEFLVQRGADRTIVDNQGNDASHYVPRGREEASLKYFLKRSTVKKIKGLAELKVEEDGCFTPVLWAL